MFQRPPLNPNTVARRRPSARDGRQALASQHQRIHLLAHRAATIQFSLPVDWTSLSDRRKRQQHYCSECCATFAHFNEAYLTMSTTFGSSAIHP
jgi:hypothetical protein